LFADAARAKAERKHALFQALTGRSEQARDEQGRFAGSASLDGGARQAVAAAPETHDSSLLLAPERGPVALEAFGGKAYALSPLPLATTGTAFSIGASSAFRGAHLAPRRQARSRGGPAARGASPSVSQLASRGGARRGGGWRCRRGSPRCCCRGRVP
jgi:hypothetical protein